MTFEWTVTLGNVLSAVTIAITVIGAGWKYVTNHLEHFSKRLEAHAVEVKTDLVEQREKVRADLQIAQTYIFERLGVMERDIREIREHQARHGQ